MPIQPVYPTLAQRRLAAAEQIARHQLAPSGLGAVGAPTPSSGLVSRLQPWITGALESPSPIYTWQYRSGYTWFLAQQTVPASPNSLYIIDNWSDSYLFLAPDISTALSLYSSPVHIVAPFQRVVAGLSVQNYVGVLCAAAGYDFVTNRYLWSQVLTSQSLDWRRIGYVSIQVAPPGSVPVAIQLKRRWNRIYDLLDMQAMVGGALNLTSSNTPFITEPLDFDGAVGLSVIANASALSSGATCTVTLRSSAVGGGTQSAYGSIAITATGAAQNLTVISTPGYQWNLDVTLSGTTPTATLSELQIMGIMEL